MHSGYFAGSSIEGITFGTHIDTLFLLNALANVSVELSVIMKTVPVLQRRINLLLDNFGMLLPFLIAVLYSSQVLLHPLLIYLFSANF
jgi:hypothetical protein